MCISALVVSRSESPSQRICFHFFTYVCACMYVCVYVCAYLLLMCLAPHHLHRGYVSFHFYTTMYVCMHVCAYQLLVCLAPNLLHRDRVSQDSSRRATQTPVHTYEIPIQTSLYVCVYVSTYNKYNMYRRVPKTTPGELQRLLSIHARYTYIHLSIFVCMCVHITIKHAQKFPWGSPWRATQTPVHTCEMPTQTSLYVCVYVCTYNDPYMRDAHTDISVCLCVCVYIQRSIHAQEFPQGSPRRMHRNVSSSPQSFADHLMENDAWRTDKERLRRHLSDSESSIGRRTRSAALVCVRFMYVCM
jgi:hypothetical protein